MRRLFLLLIVSLFIAGISTFFQFAYAFSPSDSPIANGYVANDTVWTSLVHNNILYVAGSFTQIGPAQGYSAILNKTTGSQAGVTLDAPDNTVSQVISDGNGGWFIAGNFLNVGGLPRARLAHILANGSVDPDWVADVNSTVSAMVLDGTTLYIGGSFTTVNATARLRLASVDATDGTLLAWNPSVTNGSVVALAIDGGSLYVGGNFTTTGTIGGQARNRIAEVDVGSGLATSWNPNASGVVRTIAVATSTVYVGGDFTTIAAASRSRIAEVNKGTATATTWNPSSNTSVAEILLDGSNLLVRTFSASTFIAGATRTYVAKIHRGDNFADAFNVSITGGTLLDFEVDGSDLYLLGRFTAVAGNPRQFAAKVSSATGSLDAWDPVNFSDDLTALAINTTGVYIAGEFTIVEGFERSSIAAFDQNLNLLPFNPMAGQDIGLITAIEIYGNTMYIGGAFYYEFSFVDYRENLMAIDLNTSTPDQSFNIAVDDFVWGMDLESTTLYVAGDFAFIGGQGRNSAASIDLLTNTLTPWNPNVTNPAQDFFRRVWSINADHVIGLVYLGGGDFSHVGGIPAENLATVSVATGALVTNFASDCDVFGLAERGGNTVATGCFSTLSGQARGGFALIGGSLLGFAPDVDTAWTSHTDSENNLYVTDAYEVDGVARGGVAMFDTNNNLLPWNPQFTGTFFDIYTLARFGNYVVAGGDFSGVDGSTHQNLAFFEEPGGGASVPDAISDLGSVAGSGQVTLSWSAPADNGSAITDYIVEYGITSGFPGNAVIYNDGLSTSTVSLVTGLVSGTDYSFRVATVNAVGTGAYSNVVTSTPVSEGGRRRGESTEIDDPVDPDFFIHGAADDGDPDVDNDGVPNNEDPDMDGDGVPNDEDPDADGDGIFDVLDPLNQEENLIVLTDYYPTGPGTVDVDGDGVINFYDPDVDGDGILNDVDPDADGDDIVTDYYPTGPGTVSDVDGDGLGNFFDPDVDGDGIINFYDPDIDGDGVLNEEDPDRDGDGNPDITDYYPNGPGTVSDVDGDGILNFFDPDVDGDGILNAFDEDDDGDGNPDITDDAPIGPGTVSDVDGDGIQNDEDTDMDGDGVDNDADMDIDGDGIPNAEDPDMDGDGVLNVFDEDIDGDSILNGEDPDLDGDGILNGDDLSANGFGTPTDFDGDGILNDNDPDMDGDGNLNVYDRDADGDGVTNDGDQDDDGDGILDEDDVSPTGSGTLTDVDGDGIPNDTDPETDGDGILNSEDPDVDGDGLINTVDDDIDGDDILSDMDDDRDGDGIRNSEDTDPSGTFSVLRRRSGSARRADVSGMSGGDQAFRLELLNLIRQLKIAYAWMTPEDYQLVQNYQSLSKKLELHFMKRSTHRLIGKEYGRQQSLEFFDFKYRLPDEQPIGIAVDLMKSILLNFGSACYSQETLTKVLSADIEENDYWYVGYVTFMKPWMDAVFGETEYVLWHSVRSVPFFSAVETFLFQYCGDQ